MNRRDLLSGSVGLGLMTAQAQTANDTNSFLELTTWFLHNSPEEQGKRVSEFLQHGMMPALGRAGSGAKFTAAFGNVIGEGGPYYLSLVEYPSMQAFGETLTALRADNQFQSAVSGLSSGGEFPFVRTESSLLRSFDVMKQAAGPVSNGKRTFELRTYESQSFAALKTKVAMFNEAEAKIFERLGMRPVFFGETIIGPRQPNLKYMLSYDDLAARDRLWQQFVSDPEWKKLSTRPELKDPMIVANISNVILHALPFSPVQ
jgi:hypothetical protein